MKQKIQVSDSFVGKLAVRHNFLEKSELEACKNLQKKLKSNKLHKTLEEIFTYKKVLPDEKLTELEIFINFFKARIKDGVLCQLGISEKKLEKEHYEHALITQRAIFQLSKKVTPLLEILLRKQQITQKTKQELEQKLDALTVAHCEKYQQKVEKYIDKEDKNAQKRREAYFKGKVGKKYQFPSIQSFIEESVSLPAKMLNIPPSKLEPEVRTGPDVTPPPSKLNTNEIAEAMPREFSPKQRKRRKVAPATVAGFIVVTMIVLAVVFIIYWDKAKESSDFEQIVLLLENKNRPKAEEMCRKFLKNYSSKTHQEQVMQFLQEILFAKAEISFRQGELEQALKPLQEAIELDDVGSYYKKSMQLMAETRKELQRQKSMQKFTGKMEKVEKSIAAKKFAKAKNILQEIERMSLKGEQKLKLKELWQHWQKQERQEKLSHYRFFQAKELKKFSPKKFTTTIKGVSIQRMALIDSVAINKKAPKGYFFTIAKGYLYCLYASSGQIKWVEFLGDNALFYPIFLAGPREHFNMEFVDKVLVVSTVENTIKLLKVEDGKKIWQTQMPGIVCAQPQLFKRKLYVGCIDRRLYTLEIQTGKITGAFTCGGIPQYPPSFDKRLKLMYLSTRDHIYAYHYVTGKLQSILPYKHEPCAPPLAISPYLCTFTNLQTKTLLRIYHKQRNFKLLKNLEVPGVMSTPATISSGILAIATHKRLGLFGINPAKPQEAIFSLTGTGPLFHSSKGPVFMQFSDFGRRLLVAQNNITSYTIKEFTSGNNVVEKNWSEKVTKSQKKTYLPIKRSKDVFFVVNNIENKNFYGKAIQIGLKGPKLLWQKELAFSVATEVTLASDGRMFLTSHEGSIHEVFFNENKEICYRVLAKKVSNGSAPVLFIPKDDGQLLALGKNRSLHMLDSVTGWQQKDWKTNIVLKGELGLGACFGKGTIFFSAGKGIFAISATTGGKNYLEYSEFRGKPFSTVPIFYNNSIIIGNSNGKLYSIKPTPGQPVAFLQKLWDFSTKGAINSNPIIEKDIAYFGSDDYSLYALDLANPANAKWSFATKGPVRSKATIAKEQIYFGSGDRHIYALKKADGKLLWKQKLDGQIVASALVNNLRVYVGTVTGNFYSLDRNSGKILWRYRLGGRVLSSPVLLEQKIFVAANDGFLYTIADNFKTLQKKN